MPRKKLSKEEEAIVDSIVKRKLRFIALGEEHADVVRSQGREVFERAYHEASRAIMPGTGREIAIPPRGTNMEEYYQRFEPALTANARTPAEHMHITLVTAGLIVVINASEYAYLPERLQWETDIRMGQTTRVPPNPPNRNTITEPPAQINIQGLKVLPPIGPNAQLVQLNHEQVNKYLENFSKLHHRILWDADGCVCYKIIGVNYSQTTPTIESYEVQLQECTSTVTSSFNDVKQMLLRSSVVLE